MQEKLKYQQSKKEQFLSKSKKNNIPKFIIAGVTVLLVITTGMFYFAGKSKNVNAGYFGEPVVESRSYVGQYIDMKTVNPEVTETEIIISLDEINENNIVYLESENKNGQLVPLMVYVTPTGRIFAGSSMCEPCRGTKFSLAGETLVCNTCGTTYKIETHEFISGSPVCGSYPPVNMSPVIEEGNVIISRNEILNWEIRG